MKALRICALVVAAACLTTSVVFGQRVFGGANRDFGAAEMAKIFGKNQAFTANAEMAIADKGGGGPMTMEAQYAFLKGNLRADIDMSSMKGAKIPPQATAQMKMMGMDHITNIYRSDSKVSYTIYPSLKSYCIIEKPASESEKSQEKEPKIDVTPIGKETVDGHPCVKNTVTITSDNGKVQEMTTWAASDLKDFPVKMEMHSGMADITIHFTNIKTSAPAASLFEPPSDFKKYDSIQELMMSAMGGMRGMMPPQGGMPPGGAAPPQGGNN
jgi:hypothetical protein